MALKLEKSAIRQAAKADPLAELPIPYFSVQFHINLRVKKIIYELAYHLTPDIEDSQVQQLAQNIESYVTSAGGIITFKKDPEKTRLSYPIDHKKQSYFGYIHFTTEDKSKIAEIDEKLKHDNQVLRYLLIKIPADSGKVKFRFKPTTPKPLSEKLSEKKAPTENKELDKELEGILENL